MVAEIAAGQQPVADLALRADVPLLQRGRLRVERRVDVDARRRERAGSASRRPAPGTDCRRDRSGTGSAKPPAGLVSVICAPHGGLLAKRVLKKRCGVS